MGDFANGRYESSAIANASNRSALEHEYYHVKIH